MSANKAQFIATLAAKSGLSVADATAAANALPETFGEWLKTHGASGPGYYSGDIDGSFHMHLSRDIAPTPHWELSMRFQDAGLDDFGNGSDRFGLPVVNA